MSTEICSYCRGKGYHSQWERRRAPPGVPGPTIIEYEVQTSCAWCSGNGWNYKPDEFRSNFSAPEAGPRIPRQGFFDGLIEMLGGIAESIPALNWLMRKGESLFTEVPGKYLARLAGIGAFIGLAYGIYARNPRMILVTTLFGAALGGATPAIIGALCFVVALLLAALILIAAIATVIGFGWLIATLISYLHGTK